MIINPNRRSFLKGACVGAGVVLSSSFLEAHNEVQATRDFVLTFKHNMSFETANEISIWQPLAMSHKFQTPYNLKVSGNYSDYSISNNNQMPVLHAAWRNDSISHTMSGDLHISLNVKIYHTKGNVDMPFNSVLKHDDRYIRTDGVISEIAQLQTSDFDSDLEKAKKLFAWVATNIPLENGKNMPGIRDIATNDGKIVMRGEDINASSVFVALCKACGIDAVESFGLKIDSGRHSVAESSQELYTRSAIKINDSWIPNDVVLAMELLRHSNKTQEEVFNIAFDEWDNNWVLFNFARDVKLDQTTALLSTMQYAYGEVDGSKLSSYDMTHFNTQMA